MSEADVQALVDGVAAELGAAVWLGDAEDRLVAHTAHDDVVIDEVRRSSIMHRRITPEVRAWFEQWGILDATGPVRTPADESRGILERWCIPVRFRGMHLGFMWVLGGHSIPEEDLGPAVDAAEHIAALLYRRRLANQVDTDLLRLLLIPSPETDSYAGDARAAGTYTHKGPITVVVVGPRDGGDLTPATLSDLATAVQRAAEQASSDSVIGGVIAGHGVLLAPLRTAGDLTSARRLAEKVALLAVHVKHDFEIVAAIGGATDLDHASRSYAEARRALRMVRAMPDLGPIASWDDLGVFRALAFLPPGEAVGEVTDPRVQDLLSDPALAATAEAFLELAGDVQATSARLFVHRTTLYQRLDRIAVLYKLDLRRNGDHRLLTHLGLKLSRVTAI